MFKINKEEKVAKVIRFPSSLIIKIEKEAKRSGVSFTKFVIEACIYALENMKKWNKKSNPCDCFLCV